MPLRPAEPADVPVLATLYRDAARVLAAPYYTPEQIAAWASWPDDVAEFEQRILRGVALVSIADNEIAAYGQLEPDDHLALLYTAPKFSRRGHATALCAALEDVARQRGVVRLHTTASALSRPLFEKRGFQLREVEQTTFKGVAFERYKLAKTLA